MTDRVVIGVDGGNTKTDVLAATFDGEPLAYVRGPGSNSHGPRGAQGCVAVIAALVAEAGLDEPAEHGAFFLCGADVPADVTALQDAIEEQPWVQSATVDNDTFALLYAGAEAANAVAVVCGGGINCVGRAADGRVSHHPSLGWETGDLGGAEGMGREALYHAARAEDGRGRATVLADIVPAHFALPSVVAVGEAVHYGRLSQARLGELAPLVVEVARTDAVASSIVERLVDEVVLLVQRAATDLHLDRAPFDVVLGGGVFDQNGGFHEQIAARLSARFPRARIVRPSVPPVVGAVVAALEKAGAPADTAIRLRASFEAGYPPRLVHG
jgi:N-acetylglucosamine kinase-like BadF-type ATPase